MSAARAIRNFARTVLAVVTAANVAACGSDLDESNADTGKRPFLYVGSEGKITWYELNSKSGALDKKDELEFEHTAAFMAKSADNKKVYALLRTINEMQRMQAMEPFEGFVVTFSVNQKTGALEEVARTSSLGDRPTYITLDKTGKYILIANNLGHLVGNSIVVYPVKSDGTVGAAKQKLMTGIRAHQIRVHPSNKYVYVPNIDSDTVSQFSFDEKTGKLAPLDPPEAEVEKGFGPRHLDFHPNGRWVYLSNEYAANVTTFEVKDDGTLEAVGDAVSGVPEDYSTDPKDKWQSEIRVHPSGKFVYAGQRARTTMVQDQSVSIFAVDQKSGALTLKANVPSQGKTPRNFMYDPTGNWLVVGNQESNTLVTFKIDQKNGSLDPVDEPIEQPTPYVHMFLMLP